jgi:hypothetical protein
MHFFRTALLGAVAVSTVALAATPARADAISDMGLAVEGGIGVNSFTNTHARDFIGPGASYTVRVLLGTHTHLGYELGYLGSAAGIQALGLQQGAVLYSNGAEAAVRYSFFADSGLQPYALAGVAWRHYSIGRADFNSSVANNSDNVLEVPLAIGLGYRADNGFLVDARFAYRLAAGSDLLGGPGGGGPGLDNWNLGLKLGWAF